MYTKKVADNRLVAVVYRHPIGVLGDGKPWNESLTQQQDKLFIFFSMPI
jgi:hypothetical protein